MNVFNLERVRAALALNDFDAPAAQRLMAPQPRALYRSSQRVGSPRQAAVLVLLFPVETTLAFALIQRTENQHDVHSGQISLPGGALEAGETPLEAALREAREEIGVRGPINIAGSLATLYIPPSDFEVHPFVGYTDTHPKWMPDPAEVVEVVECPLSWLLDETRKVVEDWNLDGFMLRVPWYDVNGHRVWGATAIILSEFEQRLRQTNGPDG
jgi:8-oxo-dGTP pyrophosphatase MutT (NUDIX family)